MLKLKEIRKSTNMTLKEFAEALEISEHALSLYENGKRVPDEETLYQIADTLCLSVSELYGLPRIGEKNGVKIPVLTSISANTPIDEQSDIVDYEEISGALAATGKFVALIINNNEMSPEIQSGDIVIVRIQDTVELGETAIVITENNKATCRKIKKDTNSIFGKVVERRRPIYY